MTLKLLKITDQLCCRLSLSLDLSDIFSWFRWCCAYLARTPQKWCCVLLGASYHWVPAVALDHVVKMVSASFPDGEVTIAAFAVNKYVGGDTLILRKCCFSSKFHELILASRIYKILGVSDLQKSLLWSLPIITIKFPISLFLLLLLIGILP